MSSRDRSILTIGRTVLLAVGLLAAPVWCQYPGQVRKSSKDAPELRAVAVLEWTGEAGSPKTSRLVPVAVLDGGQLQDGGIYLARPVPLAVAGEVEYELQRNGQPMGLFDIKNAGQEQGSWVGYGAWQPLPKPKSKPSMSEVARNRIEDEYSDRPVLHRKHHEGESGPADNGGNSGASSTESAPAPDADRPTLHRKDTSSDTGDANASTSPVPDTDRPTLHKRDSSDSSSGSATSDDPDRPVLKKSKKKAPEDVGHVDSLPDFTDPDRPRLQRGKSSGKEVEVLPTLMGLPPDMQQAVAVSDAKSRPEHPWTFSWANADDEAKMKSVLEGIARDAMGLKPPEAAPAPRRKTAHRNAQPVEPPPPAPLLDEQFRVFELAYGSGATLVLTAHTDGSVNQQKFVTLIAQPDLYGNVLVLLKNVADGAHLDETPRMRLVDAVDAMADNRGELLFELRGATQRQFVLYRILRGQAERLFVSSVGEFGVAGRE
jgi:hypothetical protein